jgi:ankyrin repeat protein
MDDAANKILSSDACFSAYRFFDPTGPDISELESDDFSVLSSEDEIVEIKPAEEKMHPLCQELQSKKWINYREFPKVMVQKLYRVFTLGEKIENFDVTVIDERGFTFLHYAAMVNDVAVASDLISKCKANVNVHSHAKNSPLHTAVALGSAGVIQTLLYYGADSYAKNNEGNTPLHIAVLHDQEDTVLNLLKHKVKVDVKNNLGETPLFYAARRGHAKIASFLICWGADVDMKNKFGKTIFDSIHNQEKRQKFKNDMLIRTPLHLAVLHDDLHEVQCLLEKHANVDARDAYSETPLFYAVRQRNAKIVACLINGRADTAVINKKRQKPFDVIADIEERAQFKKNICTEYEDLCTQQ